MQSQTHIASKDSVEVQQDTLIKKDLLKNLGNGYFPTKYFDIDLRYFIKYNQYEGFRTGFGGVTNDGFSEKYRVRSYVAYGFRDDKFKFGVSGSARLVESGKTWLHLAYTDDLQEAGSSNFLTDKRFFSFFEPRLLNIDLFYKYIKQSIAIEHVIAPKILSELQLATSNINPTYNYQYINNGKSYSEFNLSTAILSLQFNPFSEYKLIKNRLKETSIGFPKFSVQLTQAASGIFKSEFNFTKLDFRTIYEIRYQPESFTRFVLTSGFADGNTPLSHLYHAYPNNINKITIRSRFSVAGIESFETMYFNEFFSDRLTTVQFRHYFKPFNFTNRFKPQLVLISRFAIGNMSNIDKHQGITFGTLNKGYTESGFEINKLIFGFGFSGTYRYGGYHLPNFEDNIALKFTFNLTL
ncbi:hypothetical protein BZARG_1166 [Bizionia argentinensis JUB59]|uniref:Carboxypeptidase-like regulatory domain-containing protein n=2 Tax=Bizionia TaxID=283785 RepID=G2ECP8_9FLAO|nr:hypothetical protein BZARG_1166 [Bizionia argentinensis JUB59]